MSVSFFRERTLDGSGKNTGWSLCPPPSTPILKIWPWGCRIKHPRPHWDEKLCAQGPSITGSRGLLFTPDFLDPLAAWAEGRDPEKDELTQCRHPHDIPKPPDLRRGRSSLWLIIFVPERYNTPHRVQGRRELRFMVVSPIPWLSSHTPLAKELFFFLWHKL